MCQICHTHYVRAEWFSKTLFISYAPTVVEDTFLYGQKALNFTDPRAARLVLRLKIAQVEFKRTHTQTGKIEQINVINR